MNVKNLLKSALAALTEQTNVEASGGLHSRLLFCLEKYPKVMFDLFHIVSTAMEKPLLFNNLNDQYLYKKNTTTDNQFWLDFLKEHEQQLSQVFPWGKYIPWIAKELNDNLVNGGRYESSVTYLLGNFRSVFEFVRKGGVDVSKLKLEEVIEQVKSQKQIVPPIQGQIALKYSDDWTIQVLTTKEQLDQEGELLEHCVGSYAEEVAQERSFISSLRDPKGFPHCTIEVNQQGHLVQIQAKGNQFPKKYVGKLREAIHKIWGGDVYGLLLLGDDPKTISWSGKDLTRIDLSEKDLTGVDFSDCQLRRADFSAAKLSHCNFSNAKCVTANFIHADAQHVNFQNADLRSVNWFHTDVAGANFEGANMKGVAMSNEGVGFEFAENRDKALNLDKAIDLPDYFRTWQK